MTELLSNNAELLVALWALAIIAAVVLLHLANAGEQRRAAEDRYRREVRRYGLTHPPTERHGWRGDEE